MSVYATTESTRGIDALLRVGVRLVRSAPSGRVAVARLADAIDPDWLPEPWADEITAELQEAREAAGEPLEFRRVERVLREAWGGRVSDELDELEPEPLAVTPGAQVHRGVLDGSPVAVKVLRPGLRSTVRQDLALLEGLSGPLGAAFPAIDAGAILREVRERVLEELDFEHEAGVQRRFHRALRNHPFLTVPAPITRLAHEDVLVSEFVNGVPLRDAPDRDLAARRLAVFALGAARFGTVHAGLGPNDVLVLADGRLAILDFGATRTIAPARVELTRAALEAFAADDLDSWTAALEQLEVLPSEDAATALDLARHVLGELAGQSAARLDTAAVIAVRDRLIERSRALGVLLQSGRLPAEDLWPAHGTAALYGTIARAGATGPWLELARAALRDGWDVQV